MKSQLSYNGTVYCIVAPQSIAGVIFLPQYALRDTFGLSSHLMPDVDSNEARCRNINETLKIDIETNIGDDDDDDDYDDSDDDDDDDDDDDNAALINKQVSSWVATTTTQRRSRSYTTVTKHIVGERERERWGC